MNSSDIKKTIAILFISLFMLILFSACKNIKVVVAYPTHTPTETLIPTNTNTPLPTATFTSTPTPTNTPLPTLTNTVTVTPTPTQKPTKTLLPTPSWAKIPNEFTVANQFSPLFLSYGIGNQACGLISVCASLQDLGYSGGDYDTCIPILQGFTGSSYHPELGIQPSHLCQAVKKAMKTGSFGSPGIVECYQPKKDKEGWVLINEFKQMNWEVIVDILVLTDKTTSGTYFINDSPQPSNPDLPIAHFTRVLGFKKGVKVAVAEILHPNQYTNTTYRWVLKENFLNAWQDPENNTGYRLRNAEEVNNWFMVISPPQK